MFEVIEGDNKRAEISLSFAYINQNVKVARSYLSARRAGGVVFPQEWVCACLSFESLCQGLVGPRPTGTIDQR